MGAHINEAGLFQSDKYPTCPPGKVPLSVKDATAQDLLWEYAQRRRTVDAEFSEDLETALRTAGYDAPPPGEDTGVRQHHGLALILGFNELAKRAQRFGEKVMYRLLIGQAEKRFVASGGKIDITRDPPILTLTKPPFELNFTADDIELMRKSVQEHDARVAAEGGEK